MHYNACYYKNKGCGGSGTADTTAAGAAETTKAEDSAAETTAADTAEAAETTAAAEIDPNGAIAKIKAAGKITMGTAPDFAPWEFKDVSSDTTEYVGSDIELGKYIAKQLGVELEIKPMEFSAIQQALASGTIDIGISGFAYTEQRAEALGLSDRYNVNAAAGQGLLVLKDQAADYDSAESFAGKKVAAQNASLQQTLVQEQLPSDVKMQTVTQVTDGVMMLTTGKVDAVAVSGDNGESLVKTYPEVAMAAFKFAYDSDGNVVAVKKGNDELLNAINEIIAEVNETGLYEDWKTDAKALADSLGLNGRQTMIHIVLPQAVKNILPALCNEFVAIVKETSLASTFFVGELMTQFKTIQGITYRVLEPLSIVGIIYFLVTFVMSKLIALLERRMNASER